VEFTWRHVKRGAAAKIGSYAICGCQAKIGEFDCVAMVGDQNVLWLQVPMVNSNGMAKANSVQNLQKSMLGQRIVANEAPSFRNVREQVAFRTKLDDHKGAVGAIQNPHK
jgi:hypothetical protein